LPSARKHDFVTRQLQVPATPYSILLSLGRIHQRRCGDKEMMKTQGQDCTRLRDREGVGK
jgi:hypothetical protein